MKTESVSTAAADQAFDRFESTVEIARNADVGDTEFLLDSRFTGKRNTDIGNSVFLEYFKCMQISVDLLFGSHFPQYFCCSSIYQTYYL